MNRDQTVVRLTSILYSHLKGLIVTETCHQIAEELVDGKIIPISELKIPTVHINGTGKGELEHYLRLQLDELRKAARNMRIYGPHERDYYMQEKGAYQKAQEQQDLRIAAVDRVIAELEHILEKVNEQ